jgi:hypothetical protein
MSKDKFPLTTFQHKTRCWSCGHENDTVSSVVQDKEMDKPENGNISFCIYCGEFSIFDDTYPDNLRKPSPTENWEIKTDKELERLKVSWYLATKLTGRKTH